VQGVSLSTWGVVRKKLCFQLPKPTKASQVRQTEGIENRTKLLKRKQKDCD